ncbi:MAG: cupin domain-containing protein [Proteobacteria bacterium]|nr:cupin domain-containing protein [Pseudomonadota bacterium]
MSKTNDVIDVFCVSESTVPREYGEAADGAELSWRTLLSADRTPTRGLAAGTCEIQPGGELKLHRHPTLEVYYFLEGEGVVRLQDRHISVRAGSTLSIPADVPHGIRNTGTATLKLFYAFAADSYSEVEYTMLEP